MLRPFPFPPPFVQPVALRLHGGLVRTRVLGQGLVEYALVLVLIAIVVIGILSLLGHQTSAVFEQMACTLEGRTMHTDNGNGNSNRCR